MKVGLLALDAPGFRLLMQRVLYEERVQVPLKFGVVDVSVG